MNDWITWCNEVLSEGKEAVFNNKSRNKSRPQEQLYVAIDEYEGNIHSKKWQIPQSLRAIEPEAVIKIKLK